MRCWQVDGCGGKVVLVPLWDPAGSYVEAVSLQLRGEDGNLTTVELSYEAVGELRDDLEASRDNMLRPVVHDRRQVWPDPSVRSRQMCPRCSQETTVCGGCDRLKVDASNILDDEIPF